MSIHSLSTMSDVQLVELAANDDQEAFACLLGRYNAMIHAKASAKSKLCDSDITDDLAQEAAIGFLNAVRSYDPGKGASFRTYADRCVENVLISEIRRYQNSGNSVLNGHESFDDAALSGRCMMDARSSDPEGYVLDGETASAVYAGLSGFERSVLELRLEGKSYEDTARELGVNVKAVDNAIQRVRQKFKSSKRS